MERHGHVVHASYFLETLDSILVANECRTWRCVSQVPTAWIRWTFTGLGIDTVQLPRHEICLFDAEGHLFAAFVLEEAKVFQRHLNLFRIMIKQFDTIVLDLLVPDASISVPHFTGSVFF